MARINKYLLFDKHYSSLKGIKNKVGFYVNDNHLRGTYPVGKINVDSYCLLLLYLMIPKKNPKTPF